MSRKKTSSKKKNRKDYELLTLREILEVMKKESEVGSEPLTGKKLGSLTIRNFVKKARQYNEQIRLKRIYEHKQRRMRIVKPYIREVKRESLPIRKIRV